MDARRLGKTSSSGIGTRDPAACLSIPSAIDFLEQHDVDDFRQQTHALVRTARERITQLTGLEALLPDSPDWFGSMAAMPLPPLNGPPPQRGEADPLQLALWQRYRIEVPIIHWQDQRLIRVSCHLYNTNADIDRLLDALHESL